MESRSPLDSVPALYLTWTSYRRRSPSVAPSRASSRACSHSPVSKGCRSRSRSCSCSYRSPATSAGSSLGELPRESSGRSRHSRSPASAPSSGGSASPDGARCCSRSRLRSTSWRMDKDHQKEQSLLDFVSAMRSLNKLPEAPSESRKIHGFRAILEDDDQPTPLYRLLMVGLHWTSWRILMTVFCLLLWACARRRC